jgi:tRNA A37 threonylcarbamoyladenosine dehydratase
MNRDMPSATDPFDAPDLGRRFGGIARLYGERALRLFQHSHVCVVGIGGVGSWAAEALGRSGIGVIVLIDMDHVSESNVNRQIHALEPDFGMAKVAAMHRRIADINPQCRVDCIEDFATPDNVSSLIDTGDLDYVIDCADQPMAKAAMIDHCITNRCPIITVGGTGGQSDPTRIRVDDLSRAVHDPLLARTRRHLRRQYGFPRSGRMNVPCVYSLEQARYPQGDGTVAVSRAAPVAASLHCGGLGSATHLTASFGFAAVGRVLDTLAERANSVDPAAAVRPA